MVALSVKVEFQQRNVEKIKPPSCQTFNLLNKVHIHIHTTCNFFLGLVIPKEQGIVEEILKDYNSDVKPDGDINNTLTVALDVSVLKIDKLVSTLTSLPGRYKKKKYQPSSFTF